MTDSSSQLPFQVYDVPPRIDLLPKLPVFLSGRLRLQANEGWSARLSKSRHQPVGLNPLVACSTPLAMGREEESSMLYHEVWPTRPDAC